MISFIYRKPLPSSAFQRPAIRRDLNSEETAPVVLLSAILCWSHVAPVIYLISDQKTRWLKRKRKCQSGGLWYNRTRRCF